MRSLETIFSSLLVVVLIYLNRVNGACTTPEPTTMEPCFIADGCLNEAGVLSRNYTFASTALDLSGLNLTKVQPNAFKNFINVEGIDLSVNQITHIENGTFNGLSKLSYLYLSGNQINFIAANVFDDLVSLTRLYLYRNKLTSLEPTLFKKLTNLEDLHIDDNELIDLDENQFESLTKLKYLEMQFNQLMYIPENLFKPFRTTITYLLIQSNKLSNLDVDLIQGMIALQYFNVAGNDLGPYYLAFNTNGLRPDLQIIY